MEAGNALGHVDLETLAFHLCVSLSFGSCERLTCVEGWQPKCTLWLHAVRLGRHCALPFPLTRLSSDAVL